MIKKILTVLFGVFISQAASAQSVVVYDKQIGLIRMDQRPCTLFQLEGVADAAGTGEPWFALSDTHQHKDEIISVLLAAKLSNKVVHVESTSTINPECGHSEVLVVQLP